MFDKVSSKAKGPEPLVPMKKIIFNFQGQKHTLDSTHEAKQHFWLVSQGKQTTAQKACLEQFQNAVDVIEEHCHGAAGDDVGVGNLALDGKGLTPAAGTAAEEDQAKKDAKDVHLAVAFVLGSGQNRCGKLVKKLKK